MDLELIIGFETHVELTTRTKLFCGCNTHYDAPPNSQVCPVCTGQPGALPVLNRKAVEFSIRAGLALNCRINGESRFARKNYFYPDLPKGYQISQYEEPLCEDGFLEITGDDGHPYAVGIKRIHLEEDAGKLVHASKTSAPRTTVSWTTIAPACRFWKSSPTIRETPSAPPRRRGTTWKESVRSFATST